MQAAAGARSRWRVIQARVTWVLQVLHLWLQAMGLKHALPAAAVPTMVHARSNSSSRDVVCGVCESVHT